MLLARLAHSSQPSSWPNDSTTDHSEEISTTATTISNTDSTMIETDTEEINSSHMYSNLEAELSADGSMHVKPASTHVIGVSWLSGDLVPLIRTDNIDADKIVTNKSGTLRDQDSEMKATQISPITDSSESETNPELKSNFETFINHEAIHFHTMTNGSGIFVEKIETIRSNSDSDIADKITDLQSKSNLNVEAETFRSIPATELPEFQLASTLKSIRGSSDQTNDLGGMKSLITLTEKNETKLLKFSFSNKLIWKNERSN
ncbi:unnamed protein product [Onchocerca ochengi]|uniref:Uncharacterized protein n=1 Tax=Onchocerca ochengi TaxID=42157 RepID=A0A182EMV4_ONCOC|nr:unnamed protein product [Onchocerca ochengi]VDM92963.1 unnamed protein product [Onchocerca ochengi]